MSTGSIDERIRTVLDLGDSSAAVKGLDAEVEKLLDAFKKQTELFEQKKISPQAYADELHKVKSEVSGLTSAMKELGGGGGGGVDFEGVNRKIFALQRGMSSMMEGSGLGRAGGMLESGLSLFGGPAGIGMMAASIMYAIDQVAPKLKASWDGLFKQFSQEDVTAKIGELKGYQTQLEAQVKALLDQPVPGTEDLEATRQKHLARIFNVGTMTGPKGVQHGLLQALKNASGAVPSQLTAEEKQEMDKYWAKLHPKEQAKKMWEQAGSTGVIMQMFDELSNIMEIGKQGQQIFDQHAQEGINKIRDAAVRRAVGKLMVNAQRPGKEGRDALELLKNLATRFPDSFKGGLAGEIDKVLHLSHQIQDLSETKHAAAVIHHPGATDLQREQEIEAMEQGRTGSRKQQEHRQRQMFERDVMQRMMAEQGLKMSDPNQRKLMEDQARDEWRMAWGGHAKRSHQEQLERDMATRQRTIELMHDHPEMQFDEAQSQARKETIRRERATYPERFHRHPIVHSLNRRGPQTPAEQEELRMTGVSPERRRWLAGQQARETGRLNATEKYRKQIGPVERRPAATPAELADKKYRDTLQELNEMKAIQARALGTEVQGVIVNQKTQHTVAMLQAQIQRITNRLLALDRNADNLARQAKKSAQTTTGNP